MDPHEYWRRYQTYLRSHVWRFVRRLTFELADFACQINKPGCNGRAEEAHHTNYSRWERGMDRPGEDTVASCRNCHRWIHSHPIMMPDAANDNEPQFKFEEAA
jgi:hypothetical protein